MLITFYVLFIKLVYGLGGSPMRRHEMEMPPYSRDFKRSGTKSSTLPDAETTELNLFLLQQRLSLVTPRKRPITLSSVTPRRRPITLSSVTPRKYLLVP